MEDGTAITPTLGDKRERWIAAQGYKSKKQEEAARQAYAAGAMDALQHSTALKALVAKVTGNDLQLQTRPVPLQIRAAALVQRVAGLNRDAGEVGAGMLAQLVDEARAVAKVDAEPARGAA